MLKPSSQGPQRKHLPLVAQQKGRPVIVANDLDMPAGPPPLYPAVQAEAQLPSLVCCPQCSIRGLLQVADRSHYGRPGFLHTFDLYQ